MSNIDVLHEIKTNGAGLEALDRLRIPVAGSDAYAIRVGLRISLRFAGGHHIEKRRALVAVLRSFYDIFQAGLTHWKPNNATRRQKLTAFPDLALQIESLGKDDQFSTSFFGQSEQAREDREPALLAATGFCEWDLEGEIYSEFRASIPASWGVANGFDRVRDLVLYWSGLIGAMHGTTGLSLLLYGSADQYVRHGFSMLQQCPGLDYEDPACFNNEINFSRPRSLNKIRTINWLTILGEELIAELGGRQAMRAALDTVCTLHDYEGGVIVQAGGQPELGDVQIGYVPKAYRSVAKVTKPIRFEAYWRGLFRSLEPPLDNLDETLKWIRRFD